MEFPVAETSVFFTFLQRFGILNEKQHRYLTSEYEIGNRRVIFLLADFFKKLSPSDAYDLAMRLYQTFQRLNDEEKFRKEFGEPEEAANKKFLRIIENRSGSDIEKRENLNLVEQSESLAQGVRNIMQNQKKERANRNLEGSIQYPLKVNSNFESGFSKMHQKGIEQEHENRDNQIRIKKAVERLQESPNYSIKIAYAKSLGGNNDISFDQFKKRIERMVDLIENHHLILKQRVYQRLLSLSSFEFNKSPEQIKRCTNKKTQANNRLNQLIRDNNTICKTQDENLEKRANSKEKAEKGKVYERLYSEAIVRRENESYYREKSKENELRGCSFQPLRDKSSKLNLPFSLSGTGAESVISRISKRRHSPECLKDLQMKLTERELEHCTFRPEINKNFKDKHSPRSTARSTFDRLYSDAEIKRNAKMEREKHHELQQTKDCSFKPQIYRGPKPVSNHIFEEERNFEAEAAVTSSQECTFRPKGYAEPADTRASSEKKKEVFERLYMLSKEEKKNEMIKRDESEKHFVSGNACKANKECPQMKSNKKSDKNVFYERFEFYMKKRSDNIKKLTEESLLQSGVTFTPKTGSHYKRNSRRSSTPTISVSHKGNSSTEARVELTQRLENLNKSFKDIRTEFSEPKGGGIERSLSAKSFKFESKREQDYRSKEQEIKLLEEEFLRIYEQHKQGV